MDFVRFKHQLKRLQLCSLILFLGEISLFILVSAIVSKDKRFPRELNGNLAIMPILIFF